MTTANDIFQKSPPCYCMTLIININDAYQYHCGVCRMATVTGVCRDVHMVLLNRRAQYNHTLSKLRKTQQISLVTIDMYMFNTYMYVR
jgi:hypothetical protein